MHHSTARDWEDWAKSQDGQARKNNVRSAPMITPDHLGWKAVFYPSVSDVLRGVVQSHVRPVMGEIIKIQPIEPTRRGNIPNALVTVRGRSGKVAEVNLVEQHLAFFAGWPEAEAEMRNRHPEKKP